jgi:2-methylisocitrate lyase-like PEP mutase family enzyme
MTNEIQQEKARAFRALHNSGPMLVLPNAWDAGSAAVIARAGAAAIATTSGGVSWSLGRPDGQHLTRDEMAGTVARIVAAVDVPVTADVEGGYGPSPEDVAATIEAAVAAGAVGVNLEDSTASGGPLFSVADQAGRIRAARAAAEQAGLPGLVINARTDVHLFGIGDPEGRIDDVVARASAYAEAGADCLFVPGLTDLDVLASLVKATTLPVNVMVGPGAPGVADLERIGVRRVSVGSGITQAAYTTALNAAAELITKGTCDVLAGALDFHTVDALLHR